MLNLRRALAFWAAVLVFAVVGRAPAQTTTTTPTLVITKTGVTHSAPRSANRLNTQVNKADCLADDVVTFPITATGFTGYGLQAWVGTGCTDAGVRTLAGQRNCWKVLDTTFQQQGSSNQTGSASIQLHVRSMIAGYTDLFGGTSTGSDVGSNVAGTSGTGGSGGSGGLITGAGGTGGGATGGDTSTETTSTNTGPVIQAGIDACEQPDPAAVQGATNFTVFIMLIDNSTAAAVASDSWVGTFKLVGPQPPDVISAGVGGNLLVVNFSYSSQPGDTTGNGFNIYCDPPPGSAAASDAGLLGDAGIGTALTCDTPMSNVLVAGNDPPTDSRYRCGSGQKTSQTANATSLVDGVPYNIAVAAVDIYENTGPLSTLKCQVPQPVTGFYKAYRDAGGTGGGGFCSFSMNRKPLILLVVLGLASGLVWRRRRST